MTDTAVAADFNESLDIERNITAEVALNGVVVVDIFSQLCSVIFRKISYADVRTTPVAAQMSDAVLRPMPKM